MIAHCMLAVVAFAGVAAAQSQGQARDEEMRWQVPLAEKARIIQQHVFERNWIDGTYASRAPMRYDGRPVDRSILGNPNLGHTSSWTGSYLNGIAFRYAWAKKYGTPTDVEEALNVGGQIVNGYHMLTNVSGKPGFLARGAARGHGPSYEERGGSGDRDNWWQGVGRYADYRFKGRPSHHNYDQATRGLAFWYYFLHTFNPNPTGRVKAQMDSVRAIYQSMLDYAYKPDLTVMNFDGTMSTTLLGFNEGQGFPSTRILMVTNALTYGYWITGDRWCAQKLQEIVRAYKYLQPGAAARVRADADDTEHTLPGLWLACQVETDRRLTDFYKAAATSLFEAFRPQKRAFFNFLYADLTGDTAGADIPGALETLRLYPSITLEHPMMNSIRTDLEFVEREGRQYSTTPLPFNEVAMDNEYDWKGSSYQLDAWLSRAVPSLAVSQETPMAWFFTDGRLLYQSWDGGRTFGINDFPPFAPIRDVTFAGGKMRIALLATDDGVYVTTKGGFSNIENQDYHAGINWKRVAVGEPGNKVSRVIADPANPNIVWAIAADGVYRSEDFGRDDIGALWHKVSPSLPPDWGEVAWTVVPGERPAIYAVAGGRLLRAAPGDARWTILPATGLSSAATVRQIVVLPGTPETILLLAGSQRGGSTVMRSVDGGNTFPRERRSAARMPRTATRAAMMSRPEYTSLTVDPADPNIVYAATTRGFARSNDGGATWQESNAGLRIPYVYNVHAPRESPGRLIASTPAGLHLSTDRGATWSVPFLVLNGPGLDRTDRGGMGYLVAYWPGRYFGFVTDAEASAANASRGN